MRMNGHHFADGFLMPIERVINWIESASIPFPFKITLRGGVGVMPAFVTSIFLPAIAPVSVIISMIIIYIAFEPVQEKVLDLKPTERHWMVCIPAHLTYLIWAGILWRIGNQAQINQTVGAIVIMSTVAIWPLYLNIKREQSKKRKISFKTAYLVCSAAVLIQQLLIIFGSIFR